jgi:hypothetical protein
MTTSDKPVVLSRAGRRAGDDGDLCAARFMLQLDFSVVNAALPTILRELGMASAQLQRIVTGYALTPGSLLLDGGRLADLLGRRRLLAVRQFSHLTEATWFRRGRRSQEQPREDSAASSTESATCLDRRWEPAVRARRSSSPADLEADLPDRRHLLRPRQ